MSRIGDSPITIPTGVTVEKTGANLVVNGPKGNLHMMVVSEIKVEVAENKVMVKRKSDQKN